MVVVVSRVVSDIALHRDKGTVYLIRLQAVGLRIHQNTATPANHILSGILMCKFGFVVSKVGGTSIQTATNYDPQYKHTPKQNLGTNSNPNNDSARVISCYADES